MQYHGKQIYQFGAFQLDADERLLLKDGQRVPLGPKAFDTLVLLVRNSGRLVDKATLLETVWQNSFVEENALNRSISLLRKALGESDNIKYIETVPKHGYRFVAEAIEPDCAGNVLVIEKHTAAEIVTEEEILDSPEPESQDSFNSERALLSSPKNEVVKWRRYGLPLAGVAALCLLAAITYLVTTDGRSPGATKSSMQSLAVLPLKPFSANDGGEDLRMRLTDALITKLGGLKDIAVRPTAAVTGFAKSEQNIFEIGKRLEVDAVLDGRVQQEGERIRVTLQLVSVGSGEHLWSEQFDGDARQILDLQDAISARVLQTLNQNRRQNLEFAKRSTQSSDAYEAFLKGRYFSSRSDGKSLQNAIVYFKQAVELDPQFAEAYAGMADAQYRLFSSGLDSSQTNVEQAKELLQKALSIQPDLVEALVTLGFIQTSFDWDWKSAEQTLKQVVEAAPNFSLGRMRHGMLLTYLRRFDEAQSELEQAIKLNPISPAILSNLGIVYSCRKDFIKAEECFRKALELDDKWVNAHWLLSRCLWLQGRKAESLNYAASGTRLEHDTPFAQKIEDKIQTEEPETVVSFLIEQWRLKSESTHSLSIACRAISINDREQALAMLEKSYAERLPWIIQIAASPDFEPLRDEPRFQAIVRKLQLPQ